MNNFVCVRLVNIDNLDLSMFQFDSELSFAAFFFNANGDVYGRYGTRSYKDRKLFKSDFSYTALGVDNTSDVTVDGFKKAASVALALHGKYLLDRSVAKSLLGKKRKTTVWKTPRSIIGTSRRGCIHCHHIKTYTVASLKKANKVIPDKKLWSFPMPDTLGFVLDPKEKAKIKKIILGSEADMIGLKVGDEIQTMSKQPIISIADVQWVLHESTPLQEIKMSILRKNKTFEVTLVLPSGWRRRGRFNWRWRSSRELWKEFTDYFLDLEDSKVLDGVRVIKAGTRINDAQIIPGDIIVDVDKQGRKNASELLAYLLQEKTLGEPLNLTILRKNKRIVVSIRTFK
ncbi:hypothetical protein [Candidatus Uabimicrobium sp. HlEnr_7]|uniref:hypothetical protein n=1 Tax=Candidatus Uabimicrobium helgolandensis TaxID=3095367 RepID=UPI0035588773